MSKKKEIGKGLRALLSNIDQTHNPKKKEKLVKELNKSILEIPIDRIETNPYQPRTEFSKSELEDLAQSIKTHGVIQAITVRSMGDDKYQLISGERRLRASKLAGLMTIPAFVRIADDQGLLEMALIENIQRSNLNAIEIAISYQRLMVECELTHEALADRIGKKRSTISNYVRLLKLPPQIQNAIKNNEISMGHARALAGVSDVDLQLDIFKEVIRKHMSVRDLEALIQAYDVHKKPSSKSPKPRVNAEIKKIQDDLSSFFGSKVTIKRKNDGSGEILLRFNNDAQLNNIIDLIRPE